MHASRALALLHELGELRDDLVHVAQVAAVEKSSSSNATSRTSASLRAPGSGSNEPERKRASRGVDFQATSTSTESCSAGRLPTKSAVMSTRSQLSPASSRAARPAATSAASTEFAKSTAS